MVCVVQRVQRLAVLSAERGGRQHVQGVLNLQAVPRPSGLRVHPSPLSTRGCAFVTPGGRSDSRASRELTGARRGCALHGCGGVVGEKDGQEG
jgi:hypothetical protein